MSESALQSDLSDPSDPSDLSDLPAQSDRFAAARAARQRQIAAARVATAGSIPAVGKTQPSAFQPSARPATASGISKGHYSASSTHLNGPYAPLMRASDAVTAAALARAGLADGGQGAGSARRGKRHIAQACARTLIEHRLTGECRQYPTSPIGQPIMSVSGDELRSLPHPGGGPHLIRRQDPSVSSVSSVPLAPTSRRTP
jgi:hypothetical protein